MNEAVESGEDRLIARYFKPLATHPGDNAVGLEHEVATGRRRDYRGIIEQTERSGMGGERFEVARDKPVLAGLLCLRFLHENPPLK